MSRYLVARFRSQGGVMSLPVGWYSVALSTQHSALSTQYSAARQEDQRFGAESSIEVPAVSRALTVLMQIQGNPEMPDVNRI